MTENAASQHLSHTKNLKALMNLNEKEKTSGYLLLLRKAKWATKKLSLRRRWCYDYNS